MKVTTLLTLGASISVATASNRFPANHRRAARSQRQSLEARAPLPGVDASTAVYSNVSLEKRDTLGDIGDHIAMVAKLAVSSVAPVQTSADLAAQQQAAADKKQAEEKAAAAAKAKAVAKAKAAEEKAAAKKAAIVQAKADRAAKAKAAAAAKKAEEQAAAEQAAAEQAAAEKAAAKKAKKAAKAAAKQASVKVVTSGKSSVKLDKVFSGKGNSLIGFVDPKCGPSGATEEEPNGSESWLNCGMSSSNPDGGWTPPSGVTLGHLATVSLEHALATNPVWAPCEQYFGIFEQAEAQTGVPAILLAAFALQESTCQRHVLGDNGGAFGLMQITQDKCEGRDKEGCAEPYFNVMKAASYFKGELDAAGGNLLIATGQYNGWQLGMSYNFATRFASSPDTCDYQQNLDYLYQLFNGWVLGRTGYQLGSHQNLKICQH